MSKIKEMRYKYTCLEDLDDPGLIVPTPCDNPYLGYTALTDLGYSIRRLFKPGDIVEVIVRKVGNDPSISKNT